jgi:VanZ family protein
VSGRIRNGSWAIRASRWLPVLGWMALIFILSAQPGLRVSEDAAVDSPLRAAAHVVAYGVLGALLFRALSGTLGSTIRAAVVAFVVAALYGVSDEIHQAFVPDRTGRLDDVALDVVGAVIGITVAYVANEALRRRRTLPVDPPDRALPRPEL